MISGGQERQLAQEGHLGGKKDEEKKEKIYPHILGVLLLRQCPADLNLSVIGTPARITSTSFIL